MQNLTTCKLCEQNSTRKRVDLNVNVGKDMLKSLEILNNRLSSANLALNPSAIPDGATKDQVNMFVKATIEAISDYKMLQQEWWNTVKASVNTNNEEIYVDMSTGDLYALE